MALTRAMGPWELGAVYQKVKLKCIGRTSKRERDRERAPERERERGNRMRGYFEQ